MLRFRSAFGGFVCEGWRSLGSCPSCQDTLLVLQEKINPRRHARRVIKTSLRPDFHPNSSIHVSQWPCMKDSLVGKDPVTTANGSRGI